MVEICWTPEPCVRRALSTSRWAGPSFSKTLCYICQRCIRLGQDADRFPIAMQSSYIHVHFPPFYTADGAAHCKVCVNQGSKVFVSGSAAPPQIMESH